MTRVLVVAILAIALAVPAWPHLGAAQSGCPAEVDQAREMLKQKTAAVSPDDVQAPRSMAGAQQDVQSPRGNQNVQSPRQNQDVQSPRGNQDVQSPRGNQDVQSPRGNQNVQSPRGNQDVQSPRGNQDVQSPRAGGPTASSQTPRSSNVTKAQSLVKEAEAACKAGNMTQASKKAKSAMALLK
jgi:hypothetical protein